MSTDILISPLIKTLPDDPAGPHRYSGLMLVQREEWLLITRTPIRLIITLFRNPNKTQAMSKNIKMIFLRTLRTASSRPGPRGWAEALVGVHVGPLLNCVKLFSSDI